MLNAPRVKARQHHERTKPRKCAGRWSLLPEYGKGLDERKPEAWGCLHGCAYLRVRDGSKGLDGTVGARKCGRVHEEGLRGYGLGGGGPYRTEAGLMSVRSRYPLMRDGLPEGGILGRRAGMESMEGTSWCMSVCQSVSGKRS